MTPAQQALAASVDAAFLGGIREDAGGPIPTYRLIGQELAARGAAVITESDLAEVLHDVMCDVSHHDRPPASCSRWSKHQLIAASAFPRLVRP